MPTIVSGRIAKDGKILSGTGKFTVSRSRTYDCEYTVTFTQPFRTYANVVITPFQEYQIPMTANLIESSTLGFKVFVEETTGGSSGCTFQFVAVGE